MPQNLYDKRLNLSKGSFLVKKEGVARAIRSDSEPNEVNR